MLWVHLLRHGCLAVERLKRFLDFFLFVLEIQYERVLFPGMLPVQSR